MKKPKQKRPPIKVIIPFEPITVEQFERLPEQVKDELGRLIYGFFARLAAQEAQEQEAAKVAA